MKPAENVGGVYLFHAIFWSHDSVHLSKLDWRLYVCNPNRRKACNGGSRRMRRGLIYFILSHNNYHA